MARKKKEPVTAASTATVRAVETARADPPTAAPLAPVAAPAARDLAGEATRRAAHTVQEGNGHHAVAVRFDAAEADTLRATISYRGVLAGTGRVTARMGLECSGQPRWQQVRDVEMRRVKDGLFEADVTLPRHDEGGAGLMAVQLAFQAPAAQAWDNAGSRFGYYQVSALTGGVESVPA